MAKLTFTEKSGIWSAEFVSEGACVVTLHRAPSHSYIRVYTSTATDSAWLPIGILDTDLTMTDFIFEIDLPMGYGVRISSDTEVKSAEINGI